jgi:hypothetical protein
MNLDYDPADFPMDVTPAPEGARVELSRAHFPSVFDDILADVPYPGVPPVIRQQPPVLQPPDGNGADTGPTKPSNPKDVIGSRKLDLGLVPDTAVVGMAEALMEGALKYGRYNWRIAGVRASIYHAACRRHLAKWWNGQDSEPVTAIHHLDSAMACLAIIRDAMVYDKCVDDRPPSPDRDSLAVTIDQEEDEVRHLKEVFKEHSPHQFTIADTQEI